MKRLLVILLISATFSAQGQLATVTPLNTNFETAITIQFNLNLAKAEKVKMLLGVNKEFFLWAGAGTAEGNAFEFTPATQLNFNLSEQSARLAPVGGNRYEITITPRDYLRVPASTKIAVLGLIVKNADGSAQSETVILKPGTGVLAEVVVTSKKPFIEQLIDKTVVNVQADLIAMGSSTFDILQKAPGISITGEDNINMGGKAGVNVMIDGRPTQMSSKELAIFLRALPGSTLDKIEIISNPSSRFDAQGNAGIINIKIKKNKIKGTNGNVSAGYTFRDHYASNASLNINRRTGKVNAWVNASGDNNLQHTSGYINREVTTAGIKKLFLNNSIDKDRNKSYSIRSGIDFYANKKSTFGLLFNTTNNNAPFITPGTTVISSNGMLDSSLVTANDNNFKNRRYNSNVNYRFEDTLGNELNIDADYTHFSNTNLTNLATTFLDKNALKYNFATSDLDVATTINIYALKADYSRQIKKLNAKIETGFKLSNVATNNSLFATTLAGGAMIADTGRSNVFDYKEKIYAGYVSFGQQIKKFEYQLGLRIENSFVNGTSTDLKNNQLNNPDTNYLNLFPTAFVSYKPNDKNSFALSYSKRINRPDYQTLNPFETIFDIYTSEKGNPFLRPQYTNNFEIKYSYKYALNFAFGFNRTKDYSQTITTQNGNLTTATTDNIGTLDNLYANFSMPIPINKWWDGYLSITGFINHYKGILPDAILNEKTPGMNYYVQQNFKLGLKWDMQLSSWFNSGTTEAIFKNKSLGSLDLGVRKTFLKDRATLGVTMLDIFNTQRWQQSVNYANQNFTYRRKWESRGLRIQLSWRFGKTTFKERERTTNADAERIKPKK